MAVTLPVAAQTAPAPAEPSAPVPENALPFVTPDLPPIKPVLPESLTVRLVLKLGERRVYVYEDNEVKASYPVAIGRAGWETPTGSFEVMQKLENPGWTNPITGEQMPPGADNPLGERWIGFWTDGLNWIGFHGTPDRGSVGTAASHGCVRMYNEDVRKLYELVRVGTPVTVEQ
jgi:lipoprotein-anchoring transpeptidase ErfK/SrfK